MNINTKQYIEKYIKIRNKAGKIIDFKLNQPQQKLYDVIKRQKQLNKPVRIIILKARQMGFSTETESILFKETTTKFNINTGIITHQEDATTNLFTMSKLMYDCLPDAMKPSIKASNAKELIFNNKDGTGLNSKIRCMTAGASGVGRSYTYTNLHISELAFWPGDKKETMTGLLQAVPNLPDTMIIIESTANGFEYFKEMWDNAVKGKNDFVPLFVGWNELDEYQMAYDDFELTDEELKLQEDFNLTLEQLSWRRWYIKNNCSGDIDQFKQEYPITPEEAFISTGACFFNKEIIMARINKIQNLKPIKVGFFSYEINGNDISNVEWVDDEKGYIKIFKEVEKGHPYVLGGDTAGDGSENFTGLAIDNSNGEQVATLKDEKIDEDEYARMITKVILDTHRKGQGKEGRKKPTLFPKLVFLYDKEVHGEGKKMRDSFLTAIKCSQATMYPDYLSLSGEGYVPEMWKKYRRIVSPMGCRAFLSPYFERGGFEPADEDDKPVFVGRFNLGAISLHLPMILAKSGD